MPDAYTTFVRAAAQIRHAAEVGQAIEGATPARRTALVTENAEALRLLRLGLKQPWTPRPLKTFDDPIPELAGFRNLARLLRLESHVRDASGDRRGAAASLIDGVRFGVTVARSGTLIHLLVGIACEAIVEVPLGALVDRLPASAARSVARNLEAADGSRAPFADTLRMEKAWSARAVEALSTPSPVHEKPSDETDQIRKLMQLGRTSAGEVNARVGGYYDQAIAIAQRPYAPGNPFPESKDPFVALLVPMLDNARQAWLRAAAQSRLLALRAAVRAYHATRGVDPSGPNDLTARGILERIPTDPFGTGPLRMRRVAGEAGVRVYSVGPDGTDDGGRAIGLQASGGRRRALLATDRGDLVGGVDTP